jgi:hypothetical protein
MSDLIFFVVDWAEFWATIIPLLFLFWHRHQPKYILPVIIYLWIALFINLTGDIIGDFSKSLPSWLKSNNLLYNIHSMIRFACFGYFFYLINQTFNHWLNRIVNTIALAFILYDFIFLESFTNPMHLSGNLLATESFLLLIYCLQYYLAQLTKDEGILRRGKEFWVVTGLAIYVVVNFFVFLFYVPLLHENMDQAIRIWRIHNFAYLCLCIFIAKAFYVPGGN